MSKKVDLGFAEECEAWLLKNKFFPSKIGGKPAWLDLKNIPKNKEMLCEMCSDPLIFLCQIYAPLEEKESCFHRMLYVFVCCNNSCYQPNSAKNIKILRSQLSRSNDFYAFDPPNEKEQSDEIKSPVALCKVCGCHGPLSCGKCGKVNYCGVAHQKIDWSFHKITCLGKDSSAVEKNILFPEYEVVIEPEEMEEEKPVVEEEQLKEYEDLVKSGKVGALSEIAESELDQYSGDQKEDKQFEIFKKRNKLYPEQVLRYDRVGEPLWIQSNTPTKIPDCEFCQGKRIFEFQIMPQMLISLKDDNLDWGVLAFYTCENSCDVHDSYVKEFVFKQDIVNTE